MSMHKRILLLSITLFILQGCATDPQVRFTKISAGKSGIFFKNILKEDTEFNVLNYTYFYNGGGVAVGDVNNDGLPDIYFTGNLVRSHLYINEGDMKFTEIAEKAGISAAGAWNTGVTMVDINYDGWLDLYVCRSGAANPLVRKNLFFTNNADPDQNGHVTFTENAAFFNLDDASYSTQGSFFDYDRDGDLDFYLLNHSVPEFANFQGNLGNLKNQNSKDYGDKLFRNEYNLFFDVTHKAGINKNVLGFGLGVTTADFNNDGWVDIYVSNDFNEEDYLYMNQQDGTFNEELADQMDHVSLFSMGADAADINNDGFNDLVTLDMLPASNERIKKSSGADRYDKYQLLLGQGFHKQTMRNMLQVNQGNQSFREEGQLRGISNTDWSWSALFADYDLDGYQDLFITNGYLRDYTNMDFLSYTVDFQLKNQTGSQEIDLNEVLTKMPKIHVPNRAFANVQGHTFEDASAEWGFGAPSVSSGAAWADFDLDGDLDLVINEMMEVASLYRNNTIQIEGGHFLSIKPVDEDSIVQFGTTVKLYTAEQMMQRSLYTTRGYQSSVEPILHFGLTSSVVDSLLVIWPDGAEENFRSPSIDRQITVMQGSGSAKVTKAIPDNILFQPTNLIEHTHQEDRYNDFTIQPLLPHQYSRLGPKVETGDLNGDGLSDLIVGGAAGQSTSIYVQSRAGNFSVLQSADLSDDADYEDTEIAMEDFDGDGDIDLIIGSGLSSKSLEDETYRTVRYYLNDGSALFKRATEFPNLPGNTTAIATSDWDGDGDRDFFIGTDYAQGSYPEVTRNYAVRNDGDRLKS